MITPQGLELGKKASVKILRNIAPVFIQLDPNDLMLVLKHIGLFRPVKST